MEKVCKFCGKEMLIKYAYQRRNNYCSQRCQLNSLIKNREIRECETCGKEFEIIVGNKWQEKRRFCSLKCVYIKRRTGRYIECPLCGKVFYRKKANIKNRKTLACSVACSTQLTMNALKKSSQKKLTELFEKNLNEDSICEASFKDLIDKRRLYIDALFPENKIAIEYNGKQHYHSSSFFTNDSLKDRIKKDNLKINYLLNNGYSVIEWPYFISISKTNVKTVVKQIANQQPSSPIYTIISEKVQRLDDEVIEPINHPRAPDILKMRDDDIVQSWMPVEISSREEIKSSSK